MIKLDDALLAELGLDGIPESHRRAVLQLIYEELEIRTGYTLATAMSDAQLTRFEVFIEASDEGGALAFLEAEFPDYRGVVNEQFERMKEEIRAHLDDVLALSEAYRDIPIALPALVDPWAPKGQVSEQPAAG
ncbi:DUF5663 domain-containing protein [Dactylosporangium sp. CA-233914]|uniref:DUF5663 domain-containing protein n=1 Tax=Dactylosporangium sp. CA-233914 TaxID=3239934 RepID=UPI003D916F4A